MKILNDEIINKRKECSLEYYCDWSQPKCKTCELNDKIKVYVPDESYSYEIILCNLVDDILERDK